MMDLLRPVWLILVIIIIGLVALCGAFIHLIQWLENRRLSHFGQLNKINDDKQRRQSD